jgi:hypothetical protein
MPKDDIHDGAEMILVSDQTYENSENQVQSEHYEENDDGDYDEIALARMNMEEMTSCVFTNRNSIAAKALNRLVSSFQSIQKDSSNGEEKLYVVSTPYDAILTRLQCDVNYYNDFMTAFTFIRKVQHLSVTAITVDTFFKKMQTDLKKREFTIIEEVDQQFSSGRVNDVTEEEQTCRQYTGLVCLCVIYGVAWLIAYTGAYGDTGTAYSYQVLSNSYRATAWMTHEYIKKHFGIDFGNSFFGVGKKFALTALPFVVPEYYFNFLSMYHSRNALLSIPYVLNFGLLVDQANRYFMALTSDIPPTKSDLLCLISLILAFSIGSQS